MRFLKICGTVLLVIGVLFVIAPWLVNIISLQSVADAYEGYVNWVGGLFGK